MATLTEYKANYDKMYEILSNVSEYYQLDRLAILGHCRKKPLTMARMDVTRQALKLGISNSQIASFLGVHHTTTLYYQGRFQ